MGAKPRTCPYCALRAFSTSEEIEHMEAYHPDVIKQRREIAGIVPYEPRAGFSVVDGPKLDDPG